MAGELRLKILDRHPLLLGADRSRRQQKRLKVVLVHREHDVPALGIRQDEHRVPGLGVVGIVEADAGRRQFDVCLAVLIMNRRSDDVQLLRRRPWLAFPLAFGGGGGESVLTVAPLKSTFTVLKSG